MSVFEYNNYRDALENEIVQKKQKGHGLTYTLLAEKTGVQKTYLTNVFKNRAHFSTDQIYSIGKALSLSSSEIKYLELLLEKERSGLALRKRELEKQIKTLRTQNQKAERKIKSQVLKNDIDHIAPYYLEPFSQIIHLMMDLDEPKSIDEMANSLNTSKEHIYRVIEMMLGLGYLKKSKEGEYKVVKKNFFLSKDSFIHAPHLSLLRLRSVDHLLKLDSGIKESFSLSFSADEETFRKIRDEFLKFLENCEELIRPAPAKQVYQLNLDLFPW